MIRDTQDAASELAYLVGRHMDEARATDPRDAQSPAGGTYFELETPERLRFRVEVRQIDDAPPKRQKRSQAALNVAADRLAERTQDAYSFENYGSISWKACCSMLLRTYSEQEAEAILRSKWTRWAADASGKEYGRVTSFDLSRFIEGIPEADRAKQVAELVAGTFPEGV